MPPLIKVSLLVLQYKENPYKLSYFWLWVHEYCKLENWSHHLPMVLLSDWSENGVIRSRRGWHYGCDDEKSHLFTTPMTTGLMLCCHRRWSRSLQFYRRLCVQSTNLRITPQGHCSIPGWGLSPSSLLDPEGGLLSVGLTCSSEIRGELVPQRNKQRKKASVPDKPSKLRGVVTLSTVGPSGL